MTTTNKILIVEQDAALCESLAEQLELNENFTAFKADTGKQACELAEYHHFSVILMEVTLPDADGRDICRLMRRRGVKTPIMLMTTYDSDADKILGLDSGASDYIVKPFRLGVLLARIRAHHRQFEYSDDASFPIGPYTFRPSTKLLTDAKTDKKIRLTEREVAILKYLYRLDDRPAPRPVLLREIWGYNTSVTTHTVETHVYRLRQKIEANPSKAEILVTERKGYRLVR